MRRTAAYFCVGFSFAAFFGGCTKGVDSDSNEVPEYNKDGTLQEICTFIEKKGEYCSQPYNECVRDLDQKFCDEEAYPSCIWESPSEIEEIECVCKEFECEVDNAEESCDEEITAYIEKRDECEQLPNLLFEMCVEAGSCAGTPCETQFREVMTCLAGILDTQSCEQSSTTFENEEICAFGFGAIESCLEQNKDNPELGSCAFH